MLKRFSGHLLFILRVQQTLFQPLECTSHEEIRKSTMFFKKSIWLIEQSLFLETTNQLSVNKKEKAQIKRRRRNK